MRIRDPRDAAGGLVLLLVAVTAAWQLWSLPMGVASKMGPGFFPMAITLALGFFSLALLARWTLGSSVSTAIAAPDAAHDESMADASGLAALRRSMALLGGIIAFGIGIRVMGLALSCLALFFLSAFASRDRRWGELAVTALGLMTFAIVLFIGILNLPLPLWPHGLAWGGR
jgi:putative tricarboxylic transport membrane protein